MKKQDEHTLKSNLLGTTVSGKDGNFKPDKKKLQKPFSCTRFKSVIYLFCPHHGYHLETSEEGAMEDAAMSGIELPSNEVLSDYFLYEEDGCAFNFRNQLKKVSLRKIEDLAD